MKIGFKKMDLSEDKNTVKIIGKVIFPNSYEDKIGIEMSILQLAKVWGTDRKSVADVENNFGSIEYEDKCDETRKEVENFPDTKFWNKKIELKDVSIDGTAKEKNLHIYAEDIIGWGNEGIRIEIPKKIYDRELDGKDFGLILTPWEIQIEIK